ncbi:MAG: histone deacetylase [Caulobacterales bacterium]|nr:histone deacetylase [Caulobacterales bacterium]
MSLQASAVNTVFYSSDQHAIPLPPGHRFPSGKYAKLRGQLLGESILSAGQLRPSPQARRDDLHRAHSPDYVARVAEGRLDAKEMSRIGLPWSEQLYLRAAATVGGALAAARAALETGLSGQLAGGTHHAHRDGGAGYCVFNDFAVVALAAVDAWGLKRVAIIDLDVHQGDGNASILGARPEAFVFSMHGEKNFPFRKPPSDLDVALPDGTGDETYLARLAEHLPQVFAFAPELVLYQAGVDPLAADRLGRLSLSHEGLAARDEMVLAACRARGVPVSLALGGGYSDPIEASVEAYVNTYRVAKRLYGF